MSKRLIFILIILMIFTISGCGGTADNGIAKPQLEEIEFGGEVDGFEINIVYFRSINMEYISDRANAFNELFGKDLSITPHQVIDLSGQKIADLIKETGAEDFYQFPLSNIERLMELRDSRDILAIDELLEGNSYWNEIPSELRNIYKLDDGHVWGLPRSFEPVLYGRMMRSDYLLTLGLDVPSDLNSLYEVSLALSQGDPDGNGQNDTNGMTYFNALSFRDIFSANGSPINIGSDGYQTTSIVYNPHYGSYEDSMLLDGMVDSLEYIVRMRKAGILRKEGGRYYNSYHGIANNPSTANIFSEVPTQVFALGNIVVLDCVTGLKESCLNPVSYDFKSGLYVLGANTEEPSRTLNTFVNLFYGDLEGHLFASKGAPGGLYELNGNQVYVNDYRFFGSNSDAIVMNSPFFRYETMDLVDNTELADGTIIGDLMDAIEARDKYMGNNKKMGYLYDLTIDLAYPELFKVREGELMNSGAAAFFDSIFRRMLNGQTSIKDGAAAYKRVMRQSGTQEILDELNARIGKETKNSY